MSKQNHSERGGDSDREYVEKSPDTASRNKQTGNLQDRKSAEKSGRTVIQPNRSGSYGGKRK